jgi:hypothetical protein
MTPKLEPPGAGLPPLELRIARLLFHGSRFLSDHARATATLDAEEQRIRNLTSRCDAVAAARRVLIARIPGMEDSSRYWSVNMTLDHLRIVNEGIAGTITLLRSGRTPNRPASTAAVKPSEDVTAQILPDFVESCTKLKNSATPAAALKGTQKFAHPWFGSLDASAWYFMAGFHMRLHRRQIERILEGMK